MKNGQALSACPSSWLDGSRLHRDDNAKCKQTVFGIERAETAMVLCNGADTAAAVTVSLLTGHRETVAHNNLAVTGVFDFKQKFSELYFAIKLYPLEWFRKAGNGSQSVFQAVGKKGTQLGIGDGQFFW